MCYPSHNYNPSSFYYHHSDTSPQPRSGNDYDSDDRNEYRRDSDSKNESRRHTDSSRDVKRQNNWQETRSFGKESTYQGRKYGAVTEKSRARDEKEQKRVEIAAQPLVQAPGDIENKKRTLSQAQERKSTISQPVKKLRLEQGATNHYTPNREEENSPPTNYSPRQVFSIQSRRKVETGSAKVVTLDAHLQRAQEELAILFSKRTTDNKFQSIPTPSPTISTPKGTPFNYGAPLSMSCSEEEIEQTLFLPPVKPSEYLKLLDKESEQFSSGYKAEAFDGLNLCRIQKNPAAFLQESRIEYSRIGAGSFHLAYKEKNNGIVYRFPKPELDQTNPKCKLYNVTGSETKIVPYTASILYNGYLSYKTMESVVQNMPGVRVAKLYNKPIEDGYWKIEYIEKDVNIHDPGQLKKVGACLRQMVEKNRVLFPDFRPGNVKVDNQGNIVIIDFCEDKTIDHFRMVTPSKLVEEYIECWANGQNSVLQALKGYAGIK
ncbi:hypothetical protein [Estrella lausannensis]|uniref:Protein kinase domain-containing protein n=1 Tax=Estrella lausannensis TaxID=483423 RepID=A0A0H5DRM9_9BACT|nr:hypothetical protein [Estrella lausannensis]CRX39361.1 hypothetical protein ELAC_2040 [Estrella lausannensis]